MKNDNEERIMLATSLELLELSSLDDVEVAR